MSLSAETRDIFSFTSNTDSLDEYIYFRLLEIEQYLTYC